jgi:hypothetical protein
MERPLTSAEIPMNEISTNQKIADRICQDLQWQEREFAVGECVALLDGKIIAVTTTMDEALQRLQAADPDPQRGMLVEVGPSVVDVIRWGAERTEDGWRCFLSDTHV